MSTLLKDPVTNDDQDLDREYIPGEGDMIYQDGEALLRILDERFEQAMREGVFYTVDEVFDRIEKELQELE